MGMDSIAVPAQGREPKVAARAAACRRAVVLSDLIQLNDETRASWVPRRSPAGLVCAAELSNACPRLTVASYHAPLYSIACMNSPVASFG